MSTGRRYRHTIAVVLAGLLAALPPTACSSEDVADEQPVDILTRFNSEGKAWLNLQIFPTRTATTRLTDDNGQFTDGDDGVGSDAYVFIFSGTTEGDATFASAYKATKVSEASSAYNQVSRTLVISSDNIKQGDNIYVLVVLNNNPGAITSDIPATGTSTVTIGGTTLSAPSATFASLQAVIVSQVKDDAGLFLMTNATVSDKPGGNGATPGTISTLTPIAANLFFSSEEQAELSPAGIVVVDRVAAKVTVKTDIGASARHILGNPYATFADGDLTFALDNYNTRSYLVKRFDGTTARWQTLTTPPGPTSAQAGRSTYYRFVEEEPIMTERYRTYWAEDVNYADGSTTGFTNYANTTPEWQAMNTVAYCAENTMDVGHMTDENTTSVLVRLQLNGGNDFYTTSVTGSDVVFQLPDPRLTEEGTSASSSFVRTRSEIVTYDGTRTATIDDYLLSWLMQANSGFRSWVNTWAADEPGHVKLAFANPAGGGTATVTATQTAHADGAGATAFTALALDDWIAANITLTFYDDGYCYYRVPIRHFGDELTPWASAASMSANTTAQVYDGDNATKFLGRYGLVRNTWYTVTLDGVSHIGSPTIPVLTTNADDRVEQLINATLTVSGWEGHSQDI